MVARFPSYSDMFISWLCCLYLACSCMRMAAAEEHFLNYNETDPEKGWSLICTM